MISATCRLTCPILEVLIVLCASWAYAQPIGKMLSVEGKVWLHRGMTPIQATKDMNVTVDDTISTESPASVRVQLLGGGEFFLFSNSRVAVADTVLSLLFGAARAKDTPLPWKVSDVVNLASKRTDFLMVIRDEEIRVGVKEGEVVATKADKAQGDSVVLERHLMARTAKDRPIKVGQLVGEKKSWGWVNWGLGGLTISSGITTGILYQMAGKKAATSRGKVNNLQDVITRGDSITADLGEVMRKISDIKSRAINIDTLSTNRIIKDDAQAIIDTVTFVDKKVEKAKGTAEDIISGATDTKRDVKKWRKRTLGLTMGFAAATVVSYYFYHRDVYKSLLKEERSSGLSLQVDPLRREVRATFTFASRL